MLIDKDKTELQRQQKYIKIVREKVEQKSRELGRPLFMTVKTFGCQMNNTNTIL